MLVLMLNIDSVMHIYTSISIVNDVDIQSFLKKRNKQNMIRLKEQQDSTRRILRDLILTPTIWCKPGLPPGSPTLHHTINKWNDICQDALTSNCRRNPVPIIEFITKLGIGCITSQQLILQVNGIFKIHTYVYDLIDIDVIYTPNHPLTIISIYDTTSSSGTGNSTSGTGNGSGNTRLGGMNPITTKYDTISMDATFIVKIIQTIKSLQAD